MKVMWVRVSKGSDEHPQGRRRIVAQELGCGGWLDGLFAGTPSLTVVKLLLWLSVASEEDYAVMLLNIKCAFLEMRRNVYIYLPQQAPHFGTW